MAPRRPIDLIRDSAKSMTIGNDGDNSAITEMIPMGNKMVIVKTSSIYTIQLADQIDPERTKPNIPDTQQQILSIGSDDPIVARTLLTARTLFTKSVLGPTFDEVTGLGLAFELMTDIAALNAMRSDLEKVQADTQNSFDLKNQKRGSLRLPSIANIKARFDAFAQKAGHVVNTLEEIAKLFHGNKLANKWIDSLVAITKEKYGEKSAQLEYLNALRTFFLMILGVRNMTEHPAPEKHVTVFDYRLLANGTIEPPAVEIVRPGAELTKATITLLMENWTQELAFSAEGLMVQLSESAAQPCGGMRISVVELPLEQRPYKHQRYYYGCHYGNQIVRFG